MARKKSVFGIVSAQVCAEHVSRPAAATHLGDELAIVAVAAAVSRRTMDRAAEFEFEIAIRGANVVGYTYQGRLDVCWQASAI